VLPSKFWTVQVVGNPLTSAWAGTAARSINAFAINPTTGVERAASLRFIIEGCTTS
jgi:hypothetical protein